MSDMAQELAFATIIYVRRHSISSLFARKESGKLNIGICLWKDIRCHTKKIDAHCAHK
jgi:hypothetical protein